MEREGFDFLAKLVKERSGLVLTRDKAYLLESRLEPVARKHNLAGVDALILDLLLRKEEAIIREVTEAMTTNESFFFRDSKPFEKFRDIVLPQILSAKKDRKFFRVWSAACSSGQEPYSLAMVLREEAERLAGWRYEIVGTDISSEVMEKAKAGIYSQFEVQRGLSIKLLLKYFKKRDDMWHVDPALRAMVEFKEMNLLGDLASVGVFDVVFCRNVLIYFDQETKAEVLEKIRAAMVEGGTLFLGGAETVLGISKKFKPTQGQSGMYTLVSTR
jgi:chemotaxis protein methyltransferase CheR